nr:PHP domain-containing protein [Propionibacterium sp.]
MRADLHTHTVFSDGLDTPERLVERAVAAGLDALAVTDHDTADGLPRARAAASGAGLDLIDGLELSARLEGHSVHLLMYGGDAEEPALAAELGAIRRGRDERIPAMIDRLGQLGLPLDLEEVAAFADDASSIGRPHVADALVARGYVADRSEAFARWLADDKPGFVDRYATPLVDAIALVRAAGGVAVVAHAWSRGGRHRLPERVLAELVAEHGLDGVEADHPDHLPAERAALHALAARLGVLATGSSDYHGAGKKAGYHLGACTTAPEQYARLRALVAARRDG